MSLRIKRPVLLNHIVSPYGISIVSTALFLVAWTFPPKAYSELMNEPDLVFLDPETLLFFLLCVGGFWIGLLLIDFLTPSVPLVESRPKPPKISGLPLLLPLVLVSTLTIIACTTIVRDTPDFVALLLAQQGEVIKAHYLEMKLGLVGWGGNMQVPVLWWTYWNLTQQRQGNTARLSRFFCWLVFALGLVVEVGFSVVKVSRGDLLPVFIGLLILQMATKVYQGKLKTAGLFRYVLLVPAVGAFVFFVFGLLRGTDGLSALASSFLGYTAASYNRMAAILHDSMHYPFAGRGVYLVTFLNSNNLINKIVPFRSIFGWPDTQTLWMSEFQAPPEAGLRYDLIWSGTFGYLYSDCGWASPLILCLYGLLYGRLWNHFKTGTIVGIILYTSFATGALCWFSLNGLFDNNFTFTLTAVLALTLYSELYDKLTRRFLLKTESLVNC